MIELWGILASVDGLQMMSVSSACLAAAVPNNNATLQLTSRSSPSLVLLQDTSTLRRATREGCFRMRDRRAVEHSRCVVEPALNLPSVLLCTLSLSLSVREPNLCAGDQIDVEKVGHPYSFNSFSRTKGGDDA